MGGKEAVRERMKFGVGSSEFGESSNALDNHKKNKTDDLCCSEHSCSLTLNSQHRTPNSLPADLPISVWGTGNASREFLYVEDSAEGIMLATELYDKPNPVNLGTGFEIKIKNLVNMIVKISGYNGRIG